MGRRAKPLSRTGTAFNIEGRWRAPPPSPRSRSERRGGRLGQSPSGVGGASPRRFVDDQARCRWAALAQPPRRPHRHLASPSPHPTPPRHSASPSGGREEREADMCKSDSPNGRGAGVRARPQGRRLSRLRRKGRALTRSRSARAFAGGSLPFGRGEKSLDRLSYLVLTWPHPAWQRGALMRRRDVGRHRGRWIGQAREGRVREARGGGFGRGLPAAADAALSPSSQGGVSGFSASRSPARQGAPPGILAAASPVPVKNPGPCGRT